MNPEKTHYTVKELSKILGVGEQTIRDWVKKYFPEKMENGKTTFLSQNEITIIKQEMNSNKHLTNAREVTTDLEMFRQTFQCFQWMKEKVEALQQQIENDKPKIDFFNAVAESTDCIDFATFARSINIGRNTLFEILREMKIIFLHNVCNKVYNLPYQRYIDDGYFRVVEKEFQDQKGETRLSFQTLITPKGQVYLTRRINRNQKAIGA